MELTFILVWLFFAILIGFGASGTKLGFWPAFFISLLLSPLIGFIAVILSPNKSKEVLREVRVESSNADELGKLAQLRNDGVITEGEFKEQKKKILSS